MMKNTNEDGLTLCTPHSHTFACTSNVGSGIQGKMEKGMGKGLTIWHC